MAIFPNLVLEDVVQENDKTRLDATGSFISKGEAAVTLVEIEPEAAAGFVTVTGSSSKDWYLDWEYSTDGTKTVTVRITTDGAPASQSSTLTSITSANDKLFSDDKDLVDQEHDIMKWVPNGRNSFLNVHRKAQTLIMDFINDSGARDSSGNRLTKADIIDVEEVRQWSMYMTLQLIFDSLSNSVEDIFSQKARMYETKMFSARKKSFVKLDLNNDNVSETGELLNFTTKDLIRR